MPQLVEGQIARLDVAARRLPATGESLACRIIGFSGRDVVLALDTQPENEISPGAEASLLLESEGQLQALRGQIGEPAGDEIVLRLVDDIRLGQRRCSAGAARAARAPAPRRRRPGVVDPHARHQRRRRLRRAPRSRSGRRDR